MDIDEVVEETFMYADDTVSSNRATVTFKAVFPPKSNAIKPKAQEATRLWLDAYLEPVEIAKLIAISNAEVVLDVTITPEPNG